MLLRKQCVIFHPNLQFAHNLETTSLTKIHTRTRVHPIGSIYVPRQVRQVKHKQIWIGPSALIPLGSDIGIRFPGHAIAVGGGISPIPSSFHRNELHSKRGGRIRDVDDVESLAVALEGIFSVS